MFLAVYRLNWNGSERACKAAQTWMLHEGQNSYSYLESQGDLV